MEITITREENRYNKYMKWHLVKRFDNGCLTSDWFKTQKEAEYARDRFLNADHEKFFMNTRCG